MNNRACFESRACVPPARSEPKTRRKTRHDLRSFAARRAGETSALRLSALGFTLWLALLVTGCATTPARLLPRTVQSFPDDALITQRGVLTALGRQFTLNGYLARSAAGGQRLIVTENFGGVLADVLVKPDGAVHVMRSSRAFTPKRIRRHLAADLQCIFGDAPRENCPGQMLSQTHFLIERRWYKLDLHIVETKPGPQSPELFDETRQAAP